MITWMQRHNRWLVWTIWVATIAFIGAGFVGWGSYKYGSKASAVGKVGDIEISGERLNFTYNNLYSRYNDIFDGKFDEAQAKKMGLFRQSFNILASQAQLLNIAKYYGIIVTEKELADYIASMEGFQEGGVFNKKIYKTYLQNRRIKSSTFEAILSDELIIKKLLSIIEYDAVPYEVNIIAFALSIEDKIKYKILSATDINPEINEELVKKEWKENRGEYMTPRTYKLSIFWTDTSDINYTDTELHEFYDKNSFNYVDSEGNQTDFDQIKDRVIMDLQVKKGKKQALLDYIAVKKGKISEQESKTLPLNDPYLSSELWKEIAQRDAGALLKPKPVNSRYATVRVDEVFEPKPMPFESVKHIIEQKLKLSKAYEMIDEKAKDILKNIDKADLTESNYLSLSKPTRLPPLEEKDSLQFLQKLFTILDKKGIIRLSKHLVVYNIVEQRSKKVDDNLTASLTSEANKIKRSVFDNALFNQLKSQFPIKAYIKGF